MQGSDANPKADQATSDHAAGGPPAGGPPGGHGGGHGGAPGSGHGGGHGGAPEMPRIDVRERGGKGPDGEPQFVDRRLFVQLLAFEVPDDASPSVAIDELSRGLEARKVGSVIYADVNHPRGFAMVTWSVDPATFVTEVRPAVLASKIPLHNRPELSMLGRTYSQGHEEDLDFWLVRRPIGVALDPNTNWAIWYPLRRTGVFNKLEAREAASILREHGMIGRAYGQQELAHDIRLACHGLDRNDNEFVIGLVGKELHPLSHVVQSMRKTRQTAEFIQQMGPFFVGHAVARTPG
jgi:chlorite dismutase